MYAVGAAGDAFGGESEDFGWEVGSYDDVERDFFEFLQGACGDKNVFFKRICVITECFDSFGQMRVKGFYCLCECTEGFGEPFAGGCKRVVEVFAGHLLFDGLTDADVCEGVAICDKLRGVEL